MAATLAEATFPKCRWVGGKEYVFTYVRASIIILLHFTGVLLCHSGKDALSTPETLLYWGVECILAVSGTGGLVK
eukprot:431278-Pyramimonas_sp.AAC.1